MPELVTTGALERLKGLSEQSSSIQAAVAYWCLPPDQLGPGFARGVAQPDGFLCCDLHSPTSLDCLTELHDLGGNVYLLLYQLVGKTEVPDAKGIPDHLMHSKVLVFNTSAAECVIWVGSHNATNRALRGINFECALVEKTRRGSPLHAAVMEHLQAIRSESTRFRSEDVAYYRALQGGLQSDGFIEIEDRTGPALHAGMEVTVFGTCLNDHGQLTRVGARLFLAVTGLGGQESIYRISIVQTGRFTQANRQGTNFDRRRYAYKDAETIPVLTPPQAVSADVYRNAAFFAVLAVDEVLDGYVATEAPPERLWVDTDAARFGRGAEGPAAARPRFRIQRAARDAQELLSAPEGVEWRAAFQVLPLDARRSLQSVSLFRRRVLKKISDLDQSES